MVRSSVVLPQPLGPRRVKNSPGEMSMLTFSSACTPGNSLQMLSSRIDVMQAPAVRNARQGPAGAPAGPRKNGRPGLQPQVHADVRGLLHVRVLVGGRHAEVIGQRLDLGEGREPRR